MTCAFGSSCARKSARVVCSDSASAGLTAPSRQALEHAAIADGGEHQALVADAARRAEQFDGVEHVVHVVRRLAHAHEDHLGHLAPRPGQHHLGDDLGAAELAQQAAAPGHAERAGYGAADLARYTQAVTRQQHAFHGLAVGQFHQQARGTVGTGMLAAHPRQRAQIGGQCRQCGTHGQREEVLGGD